MQIRYRIILIALLPVILLTGAASVYLNSSRTISNANSAISSAAVLFDSFNGLQILALEHAASLEQRGAEQWAASYSRTGKAIESAFQTLVNANDKAALDRISKAYTNIGYLFDQYRQQQGSARFTQRITVRIVQELQQAASDIETVIANNRSVAIAAETQNSRLLMGFLGATALLALLTAIYLNKGIKRSISEMQEGLKALARGESGYRIKPLHNDEFGILASEFNRMADSRQKNDSSLKDSELRIRDTFENLNAPAAILDSNGAVAFCNRNLLEITGRQRSEVTGKNWFDLFMPDDTEARQRFLQMVSKGDPIDNSTAQLKTKSGRNLSLILTCSLQREITGGPVTGVTITGKDISQQIEKEETLKTSMMLLQSLIDATPDSLLLIKNDGTILASNRSSAALFNRHADELAGQNYYKLISPDLAAERKKKIDPVFESSLHIEFSDIQNLSHLEHHVYPVRKPDGSVEQAVVFSFDISSEKLENQDMKQFLDELKKTRDDLAATNQKLKADADEASRKNSVLEKQAEDNRLELAKLSEALKQGSASSEWNSISRTEFLANVCHGIRTPMSAILGLAELALQTSLTNKQKEYLTSINRSARSLLLIINDISDFSKIDSGTMRLEPVPFSLRDLMEKTEQTVRIHSAEKETSVAITMQEDLPDSLTGDPVRLEQIISTLLGYRVKFAESGDIKLDVCAVKEPYETGRIKLSFTIEDSSTPMTEEQIAGIFLPFSKESRSTAGGDGTTGLGLSICRRLAEQMGGSITAEPLEGSGNRFRFAVTLDLGPKTPIKRTKNRKATAKSIYLALQGKRILVAEDNRINMLVVKEVLENYGMIVETAKNGKEATELVNDHGQLFSAALMDIQMPVMDGIEATRIIRQNYSFEQLPVFAMTAHSLEEDRGVCIEAGMNAFLSKPVATLDLFDLITGHVAFSDIPAAAGEDLIQPDKPDDDIDFPETVPGIHLDAALERLNGNRRLLARLIRLFVQEHGGMGREIGQLLREGDLVTAARLAHSLKGVATNLSAEELRQATENLEQALKKGDNQHLEDLFKKFENALEKVCKTAERLRDISQIETDDGELASVSTVECQQQLRLALQTNNLKATKLFAELRKRLVASTDRKRLDLLSESIDRLDYKKALAILDDILKDQPVVPMEVIL